MHAMKTRVRFGPKPIKQMQIADYVRSRLAQGKWAPGQLLPHRTWFIDKFKTTHHTVQKAFNQLRDEKFVVAVPHLGTRAAETLPFANRFLILCYGVPEAPSILTQAILKSAEAIAGRTEARFEIAYALDLEFDDPAHIAVLDAVRSHRYAGVFLEALPAHKRKDSIVSLDDVPMAGIFAPNPIATGSLLTPLIDSAAGATTTDLTPFFVECRQRGLKRIAVFEGFLHSTDREDEIRRQAQAHGLECGPYHVHGSDTSLPALSLARRIFRMALAPEFPWQPEAIIVGDDNFLPLVEDVLREHYGQDGAHRFFVTSHGNLPCLPKTDLPVVFHGLNVEKTLETLIVYAEACTRGGRRDASRPRLVRF